MILFRIYVTTISTNIIAVFFFSYFIQLCDSRKIYYLTRAFRVKLHVKTDISFQVQFNAECTSPVMNFPIEYNFVLKSVNKILL